MRFVILVIIFLIFFASNAHTYYSLITIGSFLQFTNTLLILFFAYFPLNKQHFWEGECNSGDVTEIEYLFCTEAKKGEVYIKYFYFWTFVHNFRSNFKSAKIVKFYNKISGSDGDGLHFILFRGE